MSTERTDGIRAADNKRERRITLPGGVVSFSSRDAKEIAAELRAKSALGRREARQRAAEAKGAR